MKIALPILSLVLFSFFIIGYIRDNQAIFASPSRVDTRGKSGSSRPLPPIKTAGFAASAFANINLNLSHFIFGAGFANNPGKTNAATASADDLPEINFSVGSMDIPEDSTNSIGCRSFKDYTISISISKQPTSDVMVLLKIDSSTATATRKADYEFSTGNFNNPSDTVTFTKQGATSKNITFRVYDDAEYEHEENFTLGYTIVNSSLAKSGTGNQQVLFGIDDNDSPQNVGGVTNNDSIPFNSQGRLFVQDFSRVKLQILYKASELNAAGIYKGAINSIAFNVLALNSKYEYGNLSISVGTNKSDILKSGDTIHKSDNLSTYYFNSHYFTQAGWNTFAFSNSFNWDGTSNVVIQLCYNYNNDSVGAPPDWVATYPDGSTRQSNFVFGAEQNCPDTISSASAFGLAYKPQARLGSGNIVAPLISPTVGINQYFGSLFNQDFNAVKFQVLYKASELKAARLSKGLIYNFGFNVLDTNTTGEFSNVKIRMGTTDNTLLQNGSQINTIANMVSYYPNPDYFITRLGWNTFTLRNSSGVRTPFAWDGTSNIVVEMCYQYVTAVAGATPDWVASYNDGAATGQSNFLLGLGKSCSAAFTPSDGQTYKPQIIFGAQNLYSSAIVSTTIAKETTLSTEQYLTVQNDLFYRAPNSTEIISRIKNQSGYDYGCTQVSVDTITKSDTSLKVAMAPISICVDNQTVKALGKSYHVNPEKNNPAGQYDITFYFTQEEVTSWEVATGQPWSAVQVIKAPMPISDYTNNNCLASSRVSGSQDEKNRVSVGQPTHGKVGDFSSLRVSFPTGFSYFFFVPPTRGTSLPVLLQNFSGVLKDDHSFLQWTTTSEINSKYFKVERSYDGEKYDPIGEVKATGAGNTIQNYTFTDGEIASAKNYYRIRQVDNDGAFTLSNVVLIKNEKKQSSFSIVNNPFNSYIEVRFASAPKGKVKLILTDLSGREIGSEQYNAVLGTKVKFSARQSLPGKSIYILIVEADGKRQAFKVIKE